MYDFTFGVIAACYFRSYSMDYSDFGIIEHYSIINSLKKQKKKTIGIYFVEEDF